MSKRPRKAAAKSATKKVGRRKSKNKAQGDLDTLVSVIESAPENMPVELTPVSQHTLKAKRIWFCTQRREGCRGMSPFLSWKQLTNKPTCPNCGADMIWHQWGEKILPKKRKGLTQ